LIPTVGDAKDYLPKGFKEKTKNLVRYGGEKNARK